MAYRGVGGALGRGGYVYMYLYCYSSSVDVDR